MNSGGITERIVCFANALVGWMRGGMAQANIAASMLVGGVSGTAVADLASVGGMMIPGMKKVSYCGGSGETLVMIGRALPDSASHGLKPTGERRGPDDGRGRLIG